MKIAHPCVEADAEESTLLAVDRLYPKWRYAHPDREVMIFFLSCYFYFLCIQKIFSSLHKNQIEPLKADGVSWRCFSFFSRAQQCYLLGSQWDSHRPPGFYLKCLNLCSEDKQSFYGVGTTYGQVNNDKIFILGWSNPLTKTSELIIATWP